MSGIKIRLPALVTAAILGLMTGLLLGGFSLASAGSCNVEPQMNFGPGNNTVFDTDDGADEDNFWLGQNGQDFLRSLMCNDRSIQGGNDADDVGGGSGVDSVSGGDQGDHVFGGAGDDATFGDAGVDDVHDDETSDIDNAHGGNNNDFIDVQDGDNNDTAFGEGGTDNCDWDSGDSHPMCES
jgi:Ca2+-binding RTX toxin-like protein